MRTLLLTIALALTCSVATAAKTPRDPRDVYRGAQARLLQDITPKARAAAQGRLLHAAGQLAPKLTVMGARATLRSITDLAGGHTNYPRVAHLLERRIGAK